MIGSIVAGRYRVVRLLGQGGMGAVYEAEDPKEARAVALKVITGDLARRGALAGRFEQERKAASAISSPHIAALLDAGTDEGRPFLVMELLRGEDVGELLGRLGLLGQDLALRLAAQTLLGLAKAHEAGVVHRDIKPANLFLSDAGDGARVVKVLDFGVAKVKMDWATSAERGGLTRSGTMLGSPLYMAPEQARGSRAIDGRADLWSLGVLLYKALSGRVPNDGLDGLGELIIAICTLPARPLSSAAPWVSPDVAAIVGRALTIDPADRFQTAAQMLDAIRRLLPGGWEIRDEMLVPLSEAERTRTSPMIEPDRAPEPARRSSASGRATVPEGAAARVRGAPSGGARVLLVEDNELNMDMLSRRLERRGYRVLRAADGETGVEMARLERPDLVLMDISLPGIDGWTATRELRAGAETRAIPIIALTAHAMGGDREKALEAGCDDYEIKPVELPRLLAKIEALLAGR